MKYETQKALKSVTEIVACKLNVSGLALLQQVEIAGLVDRLSMSTKIKFSYSWNLAITYHTRGSFSCSIASCRQGFSYILHFGTMIDKNCDYRHSL